MFSFPRWSPPSKCIISLSLAASSLSLGRNPRPQTREGSETEAPFSSVMMQRRCNSLTHSLTHCVDFVLHMLVLNLLKCVLCWWCCIRRRMAAKKETTRRTKTPPSPMSWRSKRTTTVALPYSSALSYLPYVIFPVSVWGRTCHFLYIYPLTIIASISYFLSWSQFRDCKFSASIHMESVSRANFFPFERFWLPFQVLLNLTSLQFRFLSFPFLLCSGSISTLFICLFFIPKFLITKKILVY